jgi:hypothetical protein
MTAFFKILIVSLSLAVAACKMQLRPAKTPPAPQAATAKAEPQQTAPPSEPLSIPQTQVRLPRPQPIDPEALATPPIILPEPPTPRPTNRSGKRQNPAATSPLPIKPEQAEPVEPPPANAEALRPRVEPVLPPDERRQLIEDVSSRLKQVDQMLGRLNSRRLSEAEKNSVARIHSFEALSRQALERGEAQQASALADRALLLAQELDRAR